MRPEHWLYTIPLRLRSLFRWAQADQELDDELRDHLERRTEEYIARGMAPEEARRRARLDLGGIEQTKEKCRDTRRVDLIQVFVQDLHFGLRVLRKSPGFTAVAVITLALGICVNTTIFTALDATAFRPLPVKDPTHIVRVVRWIPQGYGGTLFSLPELCLLQRSRWRFLRLGGRQLLLRRRLRWSARQRCGDDAQISLAERAPCFGKLLRSARH